MIVTKSDSGVAIATITSFPSRVPRLEVHHASPRMAVEIGRFCEEGLQRKFPVDFPKVEDRGEKDSGSFMLSMFCTSFWIGQFAVAASMLADLA